MTALNDSIHIPLRATTGPGTSDLNPMALVVDKRPAQRRSQVTSAVGSQKLFNRDYEHRYGAALLLTCGCGQCCAWQLRVLGFVYVLNDFGAMAPSMETSSEFIRLAFFTMKPTCLNSLVALSVVGY